MDTLSEGTTPQVLDLWPLGSRVTHWDGGPNTHGMGTIIAYNGRKPLDEYTKNHIGEAAEVARKLGALGGLVDAMYDGVRCPYVVHFDPREKYPEGYKDVYEPDSLTLVSLPSLEGT